MLGTTFGGAPLACAAALAVLEVMERDNLVAHAAQMGDYLMAHLQNIEGIHQVRGRGLMIGFDVAPHLTNLKKDLLYQYKLFTGEAKPAVIRLLPSLAIDKATIDIFLDRLHTAIHAIKGKTQVAV